MLSLHSNSLMTADNGPDPVLVFEAMHASTNTSGKVILARKVAVGVRHQKAKAKGTSDKSRSPSGGMSPKGKGEKSDGTKAPRGKSPSGKKRMQTLAGSTSRTIATKVAAAISGIRRNAEPLRKVNGMQQL